YEGVAEKFPSPDLIARMLDRTLPLRRVKTASGPRFMTDNSIEELKKTKQAFQADDKLPDFLQPGNALFDAPQARELGLCSGFKDSPAELAAALRLPRKSLTEDWLVVQDKVFSWRIEVRGPLDKGKVEAIERRLKVAVGKNANFILLQLE